MTDDLESQRTTALRMLAMCTLRRLSLMPDARRPTPMDTMALLEDEADKAKQDLLQTCEVIGREINAEVEKLRRDDT